MLLVETRSRREWTALAEDEEASVVDGLRDPARPRVVAVGEGAEVDLVRLVYRTEAGSSFPVRFFLLYGDDEGTREQWEAARPMRSRVAARAAAAPTAASVQFALDDELSRAIEAWRAACGGAFEQRSVFAWHTETGGVRRVVLHAADDVPPHVIEEGTGKCWLIRPRARPRDDAEESDDANEEGEEEEEDDDEGASPPPGAGGARVPLTCPITLRRFRDPVCAPDGHVYERRALRRWLTHHRQTSPMTNLYMEVVNVDALPLADEVMRRIHASRERRRLATQAAHEAAQWERAEAESAVVRPPRPSSARRKAPRRRAATALWSV